VARSAVAALLGLFLAGGAAGEPVRQEGEPPTKFLRLQRNGQGQCQALQTSIVRFGLRDQAGQRVIVDLVSAIHVADRNYYDQLNYRFDSYDVLLYELVAPSGTVIPKGGPDGSHHPVNLLQRGMKAVLGLEFQLDAIDYTKRHFVHADLTPAEVAQKMRDRQESYLQLFFRMMGQAMAAESGDATRASDVRLLAALLASDRALELKRVMAEQFAELGGSLPGLDDSTIIAERNKRALAVLKEQIGKGRKRIGIFYGAAHMREMERRLAREFDVERLDESWLTAWNLSPPESAGPACGGPERSGSQ
jgi:hypothetical protein